jgi:hypothetical protein
MQPIFLICGYGVPEDIATDRNYQTYLTVVFNMMYAMARGADATIIPCGGPTSPRAPYTETEAKMIGGFLERLLSRKETAEECKAWKIVLEDRSLSTLENLVYARDIIRDRGILGTVTVFCEVTREERVRAVAEKVFAREVTVVPVDFDLSPNRYLEPGFIRKKEETETALSLWSLDDPARFAKHHELFERKFSLLRKLDAEGVPHAEAIRRWYELAPQWMDELLPGRPTAP